MWVTSCCITGQAGVVSVSGGVSVPDWNEGHFITQTMWQCTGPSSSGTSWVEVGWTEGMFHGGYVKGFYWASSPPYAPYEHWYIKNAAPVNSTHKLEISYLPYNKYRIFVDGVHEATAYNQAPGTKCSAAGLESTSPNNNVNLTSVNNLQYRDGNNVWVNNWTGAVIQEDNPAQAYWQFPYIKVVDYL